LLEGSIAPSFSRRAVSARTVERVIAIDRIAVSGDSGAIAAQLDLPLR
jgi:hypothetical protein